MSWSIQAVLAAFIFAAGGAGGIKWQIGVQAQAELVAAEIRASDARQQTKFIDHSSDIHIAALAKVNNQLGDAREKIALLSGRECLDAGTVSMLNAIGTSPVPAASSEPAGSPATPTTGTGLRFATERDTAGAIAVCRARYAELSSQTNQILDIEAERFPAAE